MTTAALLCAIRMERTFQVNALAPHMLTSLLAQSLEQGQQEQSNESGRVRVVYVGSRLEKKLGSISPVMSEEATDGDLKHLFRWDQERYNGMKAYSDSKRAGTSAFLERSRRFKQSESLSNACVNVCTPGLVNTGIAREFPLPLRVLTYPLRWLLLKTPEQGADTPTWLLTSNDPLALSSGKYFHERREIAPSDEANDDTKGKKMFELLDAMAGFSSPS